MEIKTCSIFKKNIDFVHNVVKCKAEDTLWTASVLVSSNSLICSFSVRLAEYVEHVKSNYSKRLLTCTVY